MLHAIWSATVALSPDTRHARTLSETARKPLEELHRLLQTAEQNASQELEKNCSSKFFKLSGAKLSRKFLQNGYLPVHEAKRKCISCHHVGSIDEPNTNITAHTNNATKEVGYERQAIRDQEAWERGDNVLNNKGETMAKNRARPRPTMEVLTQECHCAQQHCTTNEGDVPTNQCIMKCIDPATGSRYGFNERNFCLCPMCLCRCRVAYDVSLLVNR